MTYRYKEHEQLMLDVAEEFGKTFPEVVDECSGLWQELEELLQEGGWEYTVLEEAYAEGDQAPTTLVFGIKKKEDKEYSLYGWSGYYSSWGEDWFDTEPCPVKAVKVTRTEYVLDKESQV